MICMQCQQFTPSLPCLTCGCTVARPTVADAACEIIEYTGERWSWYDIESEEDAA